MLRLYLRFYDRAAGQSAPASGHAAVWHLAGRPVEQAGITLGRLFKMPSQERSRALRTTGRACGDWTRGSQGDVTLFAKDGTVIAAIGRR